MTELEKAAERYCNRAYYDLGIEDAFISGAEWAFQNRDIEKVLCAACKYRLRDEDVITLGFRHDQAISAGDACFFHKHHPHQELAYWTFRESEVQGFITTKNRFVDRKEAAEIAYSAGQISDKKEELYSEDLY